MELYNLPEFNIKEKLFKKRNGNFRKVSAVIILAVFFGFLAGTLSSVFFYYQIKSYIEKTSNQPQSLQLEQSADSGYAPQTVEEQRIISAVQEVSPAVVSIVVTKDVPVMEQYYERDFLGVPIPMYRQNGTQKQEVGGGTGFIISEDGLVVTNKHVVLDEQADYTVLTNSGRKFEAKVLARDPVQDLAVLKIDQTQQVDNGGNYSVEKFPVVKLGDSSNLQIGQTAIAIGNALGEFRNTVSSGVISGLGRRITASDSSGAFVETLENVIQTDAAINKGNSGGPLLNLKGEVIGINSAVASGAQSIGFAIPINKVKIAIDQVKNTGEIIYPFIGVRYVLVNEQIKEEKNLSVDYGALVIDGGDQGPAVSSDSPAEKAGIKEGDIILEINGEKITVDNPLSEIILKYSPGDQVTLKILRDGQEQDITLTLVKRELK
jgi:serine protease Do